MTTEELRTATINGEDFVLNHPHIISTQTRMITEAWKQFTQNASQDVLNQVLSYMPATARGKSLAQIDYDPAQDPKRQSP